MSWKIQDLMSQRLEFITYARQEGANIAELCRRFKISRKTGYKWLRRFAEGGKEELADRSRRPQGCPHRTNERMEAEVVALRLKQPTWGPRKLQRRLRDLGRAAPAVSSVGRILCRQELIAPAGERQRGPWQRFARATPNELWQMDFKGHFALQRGGRCHPLTLLDDCSRYSLALAACADQRSPIVQYHLQHCFERHGLPEALLCDNGPPWGGSASDYTSLVVWLLRLGIRVLHGRPYHPQTQGKEERFHRTLQQDLLNRHDWRDLAQASTRFDAYREHYNHERPHEALALAVPASCYRPSPRAFPAQLLPIDYAPGTLVRRVKSRGEIKLRGLPCYIGTAFCGFDIALHPSSVDGLFLVAFAAITIGQLDLRSSSSSLSMLPPPPPHV
jgi:transposase InsO family protein